jgi:hypothetical protein
MTVSPWILELLARRHHSPLSFLPIVSREFDP